MAPHYQYQPLSSPTTQIRLLELLPGRGIIQCRLKVIEIQEARGTYEPISYCWKSYTRKHWWGPTYKEKKKQRTCRIRVNGSDFSITESLQAALRQMRLKNTVRLLWADAICINQADNNEKSAQVAIMGKIYENGKQTLAWLGNTNYWTKRALKTWRRELHQDSIESNETFEQPTDETNHPSQDPGAKARGLRRLLQIWRFVMEILISSSILYQPYFKRTWVVQELVLSDTVLVMCGKHEITRDELYDIYGKNRHRAMERANLIRRAFGDLWKNREQYCLEELIYKLSPMKTSDPRDKLYSILGLHQDCVDCGTIVVDYTKDVDDVFLNATKHLLSRSPFLDLLSMSYGVSRPDGHAPSWVWNPEPRFTGLRFSQHSGTAPPSFLASKACFSRPEFRGRMLGLRGYVIDTVKAVGKALPADQGYLSLKIILEALQCYFSWVDVSKMDSDERGITEAERKGRINAFRCTLKPFKEAHDETGMCYSNWNDDDDRRDFDLFHAEICKRFRGFFSPGTKEMSTLAKARLRIAVASLYWELSLKSPTWLHFISSEFAVAMFDRRLVMTEGGWYGLCHRDTMPNDRLVLLQGANVPIILRPCPSGENWELVGECFLYGAMYGELWDQDRCEMLWIE